MKDKQTFKDEALTGLKERTHHGFRITVKSEITRAALEKPQKPINLIDPEIQLIQLEEARKEIERIRITLNLKPKEFYNLVSMGLIGYCKNNHVGIFNKKTDTVCISCSNKK
jgi:hypothetical protein